MLQKAKAIIKDFKDLPHLMKEAKQVLAEKDIQPSKKAIANNLEPVH